METQTSTKENTQQVNLSFIKLTCKHCLLIKDTIIELKTITKGRTQYLYCDNCKRNSCDFCLNKVTIRKTGYPYCYRCYRHQKKLLQEPEVKTFAPCVIDRCSIPAIYETLIYNPKNDKMMSGNFCCKHYHHYYYYIKLKTSKRNRVSSPKKKHLRKSIIKSPLLYNKNVRNK